MIVIRKIRHCLNEPLSSPMHKSTSDIVEKIFYFVVEKFVELLFGFGDFLKYFYYIVSYNRFPKNSF